MRQQQTLEVCVLYKEGRCTRPRVPKEELKDFYRMNKIKDQFVHILYRRIREAGFLRRLFFSLLFLFLSYIVFYDLSHGTLQELSRQPVEGQLEAEAETAGSMSLQQETSYMIREVMPGETVLSITEKLHQQTLPVPIETIVADFEKANQQAQAEKIVVGKSYKFPIYSSR